MADSSKRRRSSSSASTAAGTGHRRDAHTSPLSRSLALFSSDDQRERFTNFFANRDIIDFKFLDCDYFEAEKFDCYEMFKNSKLLTFMKLEVEHYPELVRVFYSNLRIQDGVIFSEVKRIPMVIDQSLLHTLTGLESQGALFEGTAVEEWASAYSSVNAREMVCADNANISGRLLAGSFKFQMRILHYVICRILIPRSTNLAQATEEDLILMWALLTGRPINWAHLVRHRMTKALREDAPLPYPHLITKFLEHFKVPTAEEPFVAVKRSSAIGPGAIYSFGYTKNRDHIWVKKKDQRADERTPSPPPPDSSALLQNMITEMRGLRTYVGQRFDTIDGRLTRLEDDVGHIRRQMGPQ